MASVVSAEIALNNQQIDGRANVIERLLDDSDLEYIFNYMAPKSFDTNQHLAATVDQLNAEFQFEEDNAPLIAQQKVDDIQSRLDFLKDDLATAQAELAQASTVDAGAGAIMAEPPVKDGG